MRKMALLGAQWGDEGKGKVVGYLSKNFDWIVRFSGGANAGHTVYWSGVKYVNHHLPSIDPRSDSMGYMGPGMVIDLDILLNELERLERDFPGISSRFYIDVEAFLVLPWHKEEDAILESIRGRALGTTGMGIGPAYKDKVSREGIRICHAFDVGFLKERLENLYAIKKRLYGDLRHSPERVAGMVLKSIDELETMGLKFVNSMEMTRKLKESSVLFEGSQGVLLDLDHGTYPFVTSGFCTVGGVLTSFSTISLDGTLGVFKAYTTRVGEGPFPTEEFSDIAETIREKGGEFGATTGRPRRVGWLDLPALRYSISRSGITELVMTKADILSGMDKVKVCTAYEINGEIVETPVNSMEFFKAEPVYEALPGWKNLEDKNFEAFLEFLDEKLPVRIGWISCGPSPDQIYKRF